MALIKVKINSVEYIATNKFSIKQQVGSTYSASVIVRIEAGDSIPQTHEAVQFLDSSDIPIFAGFVDITETPEWNSTFEVFLMRLTVKGISSLLGNRMVQESFENKYTHEIVDSLFDTYLIEEGLTKGTISTFTKKYIKYTANNMFLDDVLNELADAVSAAVDVSAGKLFSFVNKDDFTTRTPPEALQKLKKKTNGQKLVTVQRFSGASEETEELTTSTVWGGTTDTGPPVVSYPDTTYSMLYSIADIEGIAINGSPAGVGIRGSDESDTNTTFLWKYGEPLITINPSATTKPAIGDIVVFIYVGTFSVEIIAENDSLRAEIASLNGTSGKIEALTSDSSVQNSEDGQSLAQSLLDQNSEREQVITAQYNALDTSASQMLSIWNLDYPDLDISGQFVVVERSLQDYFDKLQITVKLKNKNFYSRYGTILKKNDDQVTSLTVRPDDVILKTADTVELFAPEEEYEDFNLGIIFFPSSGPNIFDPQLGGVYPT